MIDLGDELDGYGEEEQPETTQPADNGYLLKGGHVLADLQKTGFNVPPSDTTFWSNGYGGSGSTSVAGRRGDWKSSLAAGFAGATVKFYTDDPATGAKPTDSAVPDDDGKVTFPGPAGLKAPWVVRDELVTWGAADSFTFNIPDGFKPIGRIQSDDPD